MSDYYFVVSNAPQGMLVHALPYTGQCYVMWPVTFVLTIVTLLCCHPTLSTHHLIKVIL